MSHPMYPVDEEGNIKLRPIGRSILTEVASAGRQQLWDPT